MLLVRRQLGQVLKIGPNVTVTVLKLGPNSVTLGVIAPPELPVSREQPESDRTEQTANPHFSG